MTVEAVIYKYGVGNVYSVKSGLEKAGARARIVESLRDIPSMDLLILPGVGSMPAAMARLEKDLDRIMRHIDSGRPVMGICLGLQLMYEASTEFGVTKGLGLLEGIVDKMPVKPLPHIGWSQVERVRGSALLEGLPDRFYAYYVHSYASMETGKPWVKAITRLGDIEFTAVVEKPPVYGTQFHPERSGANGLRVLRNLVEIAGGRSG
ncbi:MAG: imidazole glycerol phosphate synthase subunit HisH [Desulfurococcales archaeon]|nr:imidazole glycerol phosphate synthase subunit HisH [Desulfurococcales archaeon]